MRTVDGCDRLRTLHTVAAVLPVLAFVLALGSCSLGYPPAPDPSVTGTPKSGEPRPEPTPLPTESAVSPSPSPGVWPGDPKVSAFLENCAAGLSDWTPGQVDYPRALTVRMGASTSYLAAIDIRTDPLPPEEVILGDEPRGDPVSVQCAVGARLVPVGNAVEVAPEGDAAREFTPTGVVNWVWTITGVEAGNHQVQLILHPALVIEKGDVVVTSTKSATFITTVEVDASAPQIVGRWIEDNWGPLTLIAAALTGAVLAALNKAEQLRVAWRRARIRRGKRPPTERAAG